MEEFESKFYENENLLSMKISENISMAFIYENLKLENNIFEKEGIKILNHKNGIFDIKYKDIKLEYILDEPIKVKIKNKTIDIISVTHLQQIIQKYNIINPKIKYKNGGSVREFNLRNLILHKNDEISIESSNIFTIIQEIDFNDFFSKETKKEDGCLGKTFKNPVEFEKNFEFYFKDYEKIYKNKPFILYKNEKRESFINILKQEILLSIGRFIAYFGQSGMGKSIVIIIILKYITNHIIYGTLYLNMKCLKILIKNKEYKKLKQIIIDESESNKIDLSATFQWNKWNNICLVIEKLEKNKIKIIINNATNYSNISIPKNFPTNEKIDTIKCFENLIGRVSSLLFFSFPLEQKMINHFSIQLKHGFYKNKILFKFLHSNDNEYLNNAKNYKYIEKFKNEKKLDKEFKIKASEQNKKNIICFFCPFAYNKSQNEIDDIFGNYIGVLSKDDGVNYYLNCTKNIKQIGGMNILLPIVEIMYSSNVTNGNISYPLVDKNVLSENTLFEYLIIIKNLLVGHSKNLYDANKSKFFSSLGLFLEKFPSKIYTEKVLDVLIDIGKEIFKTEFDYSTSSIDNYINMILLNEKIFSKFTEENQRKLWDRVCQFFTSDYSQMKDSLNIAKICLLLRFYDEMRYDEYCCSNHAKIFTKGKSTEKDDKIKIMNPEMNIKVDKLFDTIQIYINKLETDETINLYKLLTLDISPCLQNKIIQVYINHFESQNVPQKTKKSTINKLLKNDFIEITEYVLSISLLDIRIQVLKLFKIILTNYLNDFTLNLVVNPNQNSKELIVKRFNNIINFMADNLLPDKLQVEIDLFQSKDDKFTNPMQSLNLDNSEYTGVKKRSNTEKNLKFKIDNFKKLSDESMVLTNEKSLIKYFNKKIYNSQINSLYSFFKEWSSNNIFKEKKLLSYVLDFLIMLVCKISPDYIDNFSNYLFSCFSMNNILNKNILFENENIYPWLIETIFFFNNSENLKEFSDKNTISKIQYQTLDLFTEIFTAKRPQNEFKTRAKYVLDYSYYMKSIYRNDNNKKNEDQVILI